MTTDPLADLAVTRFMSKVTRSDGGCWVWTGAIDEATGYGRLRANRVNYLAHRFAYGVVAGRLIPEGHVLDHLCRNRACVKPDHLEPVTNRTNIARGAGPSAINGRKTHCSMAGHPLDGDNLYIAPSGRRRCRACKRANDRRYWPTRRVAS